MDMNYFDAEKTRDNLVEWIRNWFEQNGKDKRAVIGISGGKDSTIVAGLCVRALGKERVLGVLMQMRRAQLAEQRAAEKDVDHLNAAADAEHRLALFTETAEQIALTLVALFVHAGSLSADAPAVKPRMDIPAAG